MEILGYPAHIIIVVLVVLVIFFIVYMLFFQWKIVSTLCKAYIHQSFNEMGQKSWINTYITEPALKAVCGIWSV